jgi:heteromeric Ino2p/Ino4p transcription factor
MTSQTPPDGTSDRPRLTEAQKKENHIRSEQKRREAIRDGFDRLAAIVPGMEGQGRSEAVVLDASLKLMRDKIVQRREIIAKAKAKGVDTTGWELPTETVEACLAQLERQREEEELQTPPKQEN